MSSKKVSRGTGGAKKAPKVHPVRAILISIGEKFKAQRQSKGMTFEALSQASGVSTLYISNIEKGKYDNLGLDIIHRVAEALELELTVDLVK